MYKLLLAVLVSGSSCPLCLKKTVCTLPTMIHVVCNQNVLRSYEYGFDFFRYLGNNNGAVVWAQRRFSLEF